MEFVDKVVHCEFAGCNQGDFLPFTCASCRSKFCLVHKSPAAHACAVGTQFRDMTSLTCPICTKSVLFSRAEDPDAVWQKHYENPEFCTQQPAARASKPQQKCKASQCFTVLGPSNAFCCPKCKENVCLTHRRVEDHACRSLPAQRAQAFTALGSKPKAQPSAKPQGRATAQAAPSGAEAFACPFCGLTSFANAAGMETHINTAHAEKPTPSNAPVPRSSASSSSGREVCPQCQRAFHSLDGLIEHVEREHGSQQAAGQASWCSQH